MTTDKQKTPEPKTPSTPSSLSSQQPSPHGKKTPMTQQTPTEPTAIDQHHTQNSTTGNTSDNRRVDSNAPTQIGQAIKGLGKRVTTRRHDKDKSIQQPPSPRGSHRQQGQPAPSREELSHYIAALGQPDHPDHAAALPRLIDMKSAALPMLREVLEDPEQSWLTAYRAAEALGRIGDGRATGALIHALQHPNSNVRWSAVRALAYIGDLRALLQLRRVAQEDHGRTSWGESVAGAAQSALDQIQAQGVWSQGIELLKTSFASLLMILSLIVAFSVMSTLREELNTFGKLLPGETLAMVPTMSSTGKNTTNSNGIGGVQSNLPPLLPTATATITMPIMPDDTPNDTPTNIAEPTEPTEPIMGKVLTTANVRPYPSVNNNPIGSVNQGDEIVFRGVSTDGMWYHIELGEQHASDSVIDNSASGTESGWVHRELVSTPKGDVPVETVDIPLSRAITPESVDTEDTTP